MKPKFPYDKGFSITHGLQPTSSRETVRQEIIPDLFLRNPSVQTPDAGLIQQSWILD